MVRRLHDTDRSGWFYWLALLPLVGPLILLAHALGDAARRAGFKVARATIEAEGLCAACA